MNGTSLFRAINLWDLALVLLQMTASVVLMRSRRGYALLVLIAFLYPLGLFFRGKIIGPRFVRFYLADFGFVYVSAFVVVWFNQIWATGFRVTNDRARELAGKGAKVGLFIALGWEAMQFVPTLPGDWVDVAVFLLSYWLAQPIIRRI